MRPFLERLQPEPGSSWSTLNRRLPAGIPFQWHHHPEYELTLTLNSRGQRFVGDHVGAYDHLDLVLVGPSLPHTWSSAAAIDPQAPHVALVMWFHPDWTAKVVQDFVEFAAIGGLLSRAGRGLHFSAAATQAVAADIEALFAQKPAERLLGLLRILDRLAADRNAVPLAGAPVLAMGEVGSERMDRILDHLHRHYAGTVSLGELADLAALSVSGLHRLFRKRTGMTVSDYLIRLRIGDACARLSGTRQPIAHVADAVGYASLANFNRQFRALRAMTPRDYRRRFEVAG